MFANFGGGRGKVYKVFKASCSVIVIIVFFFFFLNIFCKGRGHVFGHVVGVDDGGPVCVR